MKNRTFPEITCCTGNSVDRRCHLSNSVGASPPVRSRAKSSERTNGRRKLVGRKRRGLRTKGGTICNYVSFHSICAGNLSPGPPSRYISAVFAASFTLYFTYVFPSRARPSVLFLIVFVTVGAGNGYFATVAATFDISIPIAPPSPHLYKAVEFHAIPVKYRETSATRAQRGLSLKIQSAAGPVSLRRECSRFPIMHRAVRMIMLLLRPAYLAAAPRRAGERCVVRLAAI